MAEKMCQSADLVLHDFLAASEEETSHNRMIQQEIKCGFGLDGVCCKLCSNGPCRISKARPRGVCGADADTIAGRNFLRSVANGSACYIHIVENAAKRLGEVAKNKGFIKGENALERLCGILEVTGADKWEKAAKISAMVLEDLRRPYEEKMQIIHKLGYGPRLAKWTELGILPGGAKDEIFIANVKTSTNLNSDPVDMLLHCLRLGISTGFYGLMMTNLINDILMGESQIGFDAVGMSTIDPDYVNIMITGHQHALFGNLTEMLSRPEMSSIAQQAGAKGVKIVGCTCVGQDFQVRGCNYKDVFCGHAGNNYASEAILMTGCIDLVVSEFNCTIPGIEDKCQSRGIPMICIDDVAKKKGATLLQYSDAEKETISTQIVTQAIASYGARVGTTKRTNPMANHAANTEAVTGVTDVTLKNFLGGNYSALIDLIVKGQIKGVAAVVGCSNLRTKGYDVMTVEMTKALIKKDILVLSAGCTSGGLENVGLMSREAADLAGDNLKAVCKALGIPPVLNFGPCLAIGRLETVAGDIAAELGVDIPQLPIVVSAPQWLEEQALADGSFALALGFNLHLGLPPFVTGSPVIVDVLTNQMPALTGGRLMIETESEAAADAIEAVIMEKRKGLGL